MNEKIRQLRHDKVQAQDFFSKCIAYTTGPYELKEKLEQGIAKVIDVRSKESYAQGHIPGAISIPKEEITQDLTQLSKNEIVTVYCSNQQCHMGAKACYLLTEYGYPVILMEGGFKAWKEDFGFPVET